MGVQRLYTQQQSQATSTGTGDVKTLSPPTAEACRHCVVSAETNDARITLDGTTPSSSNGHVLPKNALPLYLPLAGALKFASTVAGSSIVNVTWISD